MLFTAEVTTPANTASTSPTTEIIKIAHGIITLLSVHFPAGCHGLVHATISSHEHQIAPSTEGMDMAGDDGVIGWAEYYESYQPPYELKVETWSDGTTYDHAITVRVVILPRRAIIANQIVDAIRTVLGMLSPTRIFTAKE